MSSRAEPTALDRLGGVAPEVVDAAADDGQRRAKLVAGVGGELALAAEGGPLCGERLADRDERATGVDRAEPEGDQDDDQAAREQDREHDLEGPDLGRPVLDDLDREGLLVDLDRLGQDADGRAGDLGRADVPSGRRGGRSRRPGTAGPAVAGRAAGRADHRAVRTDDQHVVPDPPPPKMNP